MKVKIFKTETCPFCKMETEYLNDKGIKFEEIYVDKDPEAANEVIKTSGQMGVPYTVVTKDDGTSEGILGFDKDALNKLLNIQQ